MIRWRQDQQNLAVDFDTGPVQLTDQQRQPLQQATSLIRRRCHDMPAPVLHVRVSQDDRDHEFEVEMSLEAMQRSLKGIGKADDLPEAVELAMEKILSQMGPFKAALRRDETYRLHHPQNVIEGIGARASSLSKEGPETRKVEKQLGGYWRPLVRQVSREIAALEINGLLPLGEIAAQDIVDEVIVRTYENLSQRPQDEPLEVWLYRLARQTLAQRREQLQRETPMSSMPPQRSMKESLPLPEPSPLTDAEAVLMDLLEPEPDKIPGEDFADHGEPDIPLHRTRMQQALGRFLSHLPAVQRETIWLHYLDGYDPGEIAAVQNRDEKEVRDGLAQSVSRLRDALQGWPGQTSEIRDEGHYHVKPESPQEGG